MEYSEYFGSCVMSSFELFIAPRSKKIIVLERLEFFELMSAGSKKVIVLEHFEYFLNCLG